MDDVARHVSWHANELETAVLDDIGGWGRRVQKKLKPVVGHSVAEEIADAEREFTRAVRAVASAYGTLNDLAAPLERLERSRAGSGAESTDNIDIEQLLSDVQSDDISTSKAAVLAVVERVIVGQDQVEVIPRV
jgi:hypothetical protein